MRAPWTFPRAAAIAAGGALGATVRWMVVTAWTPGPFPWPVLAVNVVGSLVLGVLLAEEWSHPAHRLVVHDFGGIGFCGGLTTFSTFSVEVVNLARDGDTMTAVIYTLASLVASFAAVVGGAATLRGVRAIATPLEEQP